MSSIITTIIVEVHCVRPVWAEKHWNEKYRDSRYRLYVDNDLITERTWIWDNSTYLREHLQVNLDHSVTQKLHVLRLEAVTHIPEQAKFGLQSMTLEPGNLIVKSASLTEISFKVA